jgi:hypothetical protein
LCVLQLRALWKTSLENPVFIEAGLEWIRDHGQAGTSSTPSS